MLKAILFDLDDTLLWDHKSVCEAFKTTCQKAARRYEIHPEKLEERVRFHAKALYRTYETHDFVSDIGIGPFESMWGEFQDTGADFKKLREIVPAFRKQAWSSALKDLDIQDHDLATSLADTFPEERKKHVYLFDDTMEVLRQLKDQYKLLMLTNGSPDLQQTKLAMSPELKPFFDHIVISGAFGAGKPSVDIFNHALNLLNVEKTEAVMIGDNPQTDILGASRAGINSVWINHRTRTLGEVSPTFEVDRLREALPVIRSLS